MRAVLSCRREEAEGRSSSDILAEALQLDTGPEDDKCHSPSLHNDSSSALLPIVQVSGNNDNDVAW